MSAADSTPYRVSYVTASDRMRAVHLFIDAAGEIDIFIIQFWNCADASLVTILTEGAPFVWSINIDHEEERARLAMDALVQERWQNFADLALAEMESQRRQQATTAAGGAR